MLSWTGDDALVVGGHAFRLGYPEVKADDLAAGDFSVLKPRWMVEHYVEFLRDLQPRSVFELGIAKGGSTALFATLVQPRRYVAIDLEDNSTPLFKQWLTRGPLSDHVSAYFGVDQGDVASLQAIAASEFGGGEVDLVIDDASHLLDLTRASFDALFPYLRRGGVYIIEDWESLHQFDKAVQEKIDADPAARAGWEQRLREGSQELVDSERPLTHLIVELVLAAAYSDVIEDIHVRRGSLAVRRGSEQATREGWRLSNSYSRWGRGLLGAS